MQFRLNKILKALALSASLACSPSLLANLNQETTEVEMRFNLPSSTASDGVFKAREQFNIADESTYDFKTSVDIFDAQGRPLKQTFYFLKVSATDWLIATSVNGVLIDFLANDGNAAANNSPNALGSTESGITIAGRMIFDSLGRITDVYAGDNQPISGANANKISTAALGAEVVSSSEDADQKITLNFNVENNDFFVKPTHFDYDFTVWKWEVDGSTDNPFNIEIEEISGSSIDGDLIDNSKLEPVAINNNSEIALNLDISVTNVKRVNGVYRFRNGVLKVVAAPNVSVELVDLNDNGEMIATTSGTTNPRFRFFDGVSPNTTAPTPYTILGTNSAKAYALNNKRQILVGFGSARNSSNVVSLYQVAPVNNQWRAQQILRVNTHAPSTGLEDIPLPNNVNFTVSSLSIDTEAENATVISGLSDDGTFRIGMKYTGEISGNTSSCSNVTTLNFNSELKFQKNAEGDYEATSTTLNNNQIVEDPVTIVDSFSNFFVNVAPKNLIANRGMEPFDLQYSSPFVDADNDGEIDTPEVLLTSKPGQAQTGQVNGCAIDFESTYCTVVGATFASMGELNQECHFEAYNSKVGFGQLAVNDNSGLIPFILTGMTDSNQTGALTLNSSAASQISSVLSPTSSQWTITEFRDVNELNEFVGLGKIGEGPTLPIIGRTAVLPSPTKLRARAFFSRNDEDTYDRVELTWNRVAGAERYEVYELDETSGVFNELLVDGTNQTVNQYIDIENVPDVYTIAIRACNDVGCGFLSESVTFRTDQDSDGDGLLDREELEFGTDPLAQDSDDDGLSDYKEFLENTNPLSNDTDGDGLTDNYEVLNGLDPTSEDTDSDGLNDGDEVNVYMTLANNADTDQDGRLDGEEINGDPATDPLDADSDDDGLNDGEEVNGMPATDPNSTDTDGDGLTDLFEVNSVLGLDPTNNDTDGDQLPDGAEINTYGSSPVSSDSDNDGLNDYLEVITLLTSPILADTDGDGLSDFAEVEQYQTDPLVLDTDGDGLTDSHEIIGLFDEQGNQTSPATGTSATNADTDGDGLNDGDEVNYVSPITGNSLNPLAIDTDGDGLKDGFELDLGLDPTDATDADRLVWVPISVGGITVFIPVVND